jgi:hypothetical protein
MLARLVVYVQAAPGWLQGSMSGSMLAEVLRCCSRLFRWRDRHTPLAPEAACAAAAAAAAACISHKSLIAS